MIWKYDVSAVIVNRSFSTNLDTMRGVWKYNLIFELINNLQLLFYDSRFFVLV